MDFKKSKKYTESYKTEFLNKLNEGKMVDVQEGQNLKVAEVSKELPKNAKIEKDEKQSFEDYKTMYKDVITQKCIEDYGVDTDTKLWEDTAKELYLKSKTYIPTGEEKPEEVLVKKEESKSQKLNESDEEGYSSIRQISQAEKILLDIIKSVGDYSLQDVVCETTQTGDIHIMTRDGRDITTVDRSIFAIDGDDTELIDELRDNGYWKEDFDESKNLKGDLSNKSKFLIHILNGVIKNIQDKFNVEATAEFTKDEDEIVIYIRGNTLDLIDATSYLAKTIRRDDVDFEFDENITDNTIKCYIAPKIEENKKLKEAKITDYISENQLDSAIKNNKILNRAKSYEVLNDMVLEITTDMGKSYYKIIKNNDNNFEAYLVDRNGKKLGDSFELIKMEESKLQENNTNLDNIAKELFDFDDYYLELALKYKNKDNFIRKNKEDIEAIEDEYNLTYIEACEVLAKIYDLSIQNKSNINESKINKIIANKGILNEIKKFDDKTIKDAFLNMCELEQISVKNQIQVFQECRRLTGKEPLTENNTDSEYQYMLLDRLKTDCEYFLGNGNRNEKHLWAGSVDAQIKEMKKIWNSLKEKPEWLTMEDINNYEKLIKDKKAIRQSKNLIKKYNKELNTNLDED